MTQPEQEEQPVGDDASPSDQQLIASTREGDGDAFAALWSRHSAAGRRLARTVTHQIDPDDLVSEAYMKVFAAVKKGGGPTGPFRPYLFVTIRNLAVSWGRIKREDNIEVPEDFPDPRATDTPILAALDTGLTLQAFRSLPERWQQVLWFTEVEGLTPADIAGRLGMSANSVAALAYRAREGLRQAWIQAHIDSSGKESEHAWALERVGKNARGGLAHRDQAKFDAHLRGCPPCTMLAAEAADLSGQFTTTILPLSVGIIGIVGLSWISAPSDATAATRAPEDGSSANQGSPTSHAQRKGRRRHKRAGVALGIALALSISGAGIAYQMTFTGSPLGSPQLEVSTGTGAPPHDTLAPSPLAPTETPPAPPADPTPRATPQERTEEPAPPRVPGEPRPGNQNNPTPDVPANPAAPTTINAVDTASGALYPILTGGAEPGSLVQLADRGQILATVQTDVRGQWRSNELRVPTGTSQISATSGESTAAVSVTLRQPIVSTSFDATTLTVRITGVSSTLYTATWDGAELGQGAADPSGAAIIRGTVSTTAGSHTVTVNAINDGRTGPSTTVVVNL